MEEIKVLTRTLSQKELIDVTKFANERYSSGSAPEHIQHLINLTTAYTASKVVKNGAPVLVVNKY